MADKKKELPADLAKFRDSYVEMFGALPPLPAARFEFSGEVESGVPAGVGAAAGRRVLLRRARHEDHPAHPVRHAAGRAQHGRRAGACRGGAPRRRELGGAAHGHASLRRRPARCGPANNGGALLKALRDKEAGRSRRALRYRPSPGSSLSALPRSIAARSAARELQRGEPLDGGLRRPERIVACRTAGATSARCRAPRCSAPGVVTPTTST